MKLQQLRYAVEIFRHNLNISEAAEALFTSQPGVSKQIRLLEEELGTQIFIRSGKRIVAVTPPGLAVLEKAEQILRDVQNIKNISGEFTDTHSGTLTVAAVHTQMRFRLPETVARFMEAYPDVRLTLRPGSADEVAEMVYNGEADLALAADTSDRFAELSRLPCAAQQYALLVPRGHRLTEQAELTLQEVAVQPLLTYPDALQSGSVLARAFNRARISHYRVALAAYDDDLLKHYVRIGLGVALLNRQACTGDDQELMALDTAHLFESAPLHILLRPDTLMRGYVYDFIESLNPDLNKEKINRLLYTPAVEDFSI